MFEYQASVFARYPLVFAKLIKFGRNHFQIMNFLNILELNIDAVVANMAVVKKIKTFLTNNSVFMNNYPQPILI